MALTTLPQGIRLAMDHDEEYDMGTITADVDNGVSKRRPGYSSPIVRRKVKLVALSYQAKEDAKRWWIDDLKGGTAFFTYVDPFTHQPKQAQFVMPRFKWRMRAREVWECDAILLSVEA